MNLLKQWSSVLLRIGLSIVLVIFVGVGLFPSQSAVATTLTESTNQSSVEIAMNRGDAINKNIEGKVQELKGKISDSPQDQIAGKAKQAQADVMNAGQDIKDNAGLSGRAKAAAKDSEGKAQELKGKITDSPQDQIMGKAKQVQSDGQNFIEDIKDNVQDIFN
ncbi:MAG: CsbD family protein [Cyanobacterium sp.]